MIHVHDPELVPLALWLRLTTRAAIVVDVHEDLRLQVRSKPWIPAPLRGLAALAARLLDAIASLAAHRIVAATPAIARRYPADRTTVVHNYPRPDEWPAIRPTPWRERTPELLFVGGLTAIRGARVMFDALLEPPLAERRLLVVGAIDEAVAAMLAAHPARDRVEVTGWLERAAMPALLESRGQVGLVVFQPVPNHTEALPNKLFEYMAWGVPSIASAFPLWRGIVEDAGSGLLVEPTVAAAVAAAAARILGDPSLGDAMAAAGRRAVAERYDWTHEAAALVGVYDELRRLTRRGGDR